MDDELSEISANEHLMQLAIITVLEQISRNAFQAGYSRAQWDANDCILSAPPTEDQYIEHLRNQPIVKAYLNGEV